ncbi:hypothetical protein BJX64DRAFT_204730 [Aspergillus heterothallicus]
MHAKFLALLAVAPLALGQDWFDDAMDALESSGPVPTDVDAPTLDDYLEDSDIFDDIDTTNDFSSDSDSDDTSFSSSSDSEDDSSSIDNIFADIPSSIISELATAIPASVLQELATPASLSSIANEISAGNYPAWVTDLPDDVVDYLETAWGVDTGAFPTGSSSSSSSDDEEDSNSSSSNSNSNRPTSGGDDTGDDDAAGMLSPSVFASVVGAVGVLGIALAL